jgi:hypothetical protein
MMKILTKISDYLKALTLSTSNYSSRRFIAIGAFFILCIDNLVCLFTTHKLESELFWGFIGLCCTFSGLTTVTNLKAMTLKREIVAEVSAADEPKETAEAAKTVIETK